MTCHTPLVFVGHTRSLFFSHILKPREPHFMGEPFFASTQCIDTSCLSPDPLVFPLDLSSPFCSGYLGDRVLKLFALAHLEL
jgi:hypothetical protein